MNEPLAPTITLVAEHSMEALNRVVTVLRARRYRITSLDLRPSGAREMSIALRLDAASGSVTRAVTLLQRIEEVVEVKVSD